MYNYMTETVNQWNVAWWAPGAIFDFAMEQNSSWWQCTHEVSDEDENSLRKKIFPWRNSFVEHFLDQWVKLLHHYLSSLFTAWNTERCLRKTNKPTNPKDQQNAIIFKYTCAIFRERKLQKFQHGNFCNEKTKRDLCWATISGNCVSCFSSVGRQFWIGLSVGTILSRNVPCCSLFVIYGCLVISTTWTLKESTSSCMTTRLVGITGGMLCG